MGLALGLALAACLGVHVVEEVEQVEALLVRIRVRARARVVGL